jgi:hypothetical protein
MVDYGGMPALQQCGMHSSNLVKLCACTVSAAAVQHCMPQATVLQMQFWLPGTLRKHFESISHFDHTLVKAWLRSFICNFWGIWFGPPCCCLLATGGCGRHPKSSKARI